MTKEIKYGLYGIGALVTMVVIYLIYKALSRVASNVTTKAAVIADKAQSDSLSKAFGVDEYSVEHARSVAKELAVELETFKDMSTFDKVTHVQTDWATLEILRKARTEKEFRLVAHFYRNMMTDNKSLYNDLKDVLGSKHFRGVRFIDSIMTI